MYPPFHFDDEGANHLKGKRTKITEEMIERAKEWNNFRGNKHTIRADGQSSLIGNLGEICFLLMYPEAKQISTTNYEADFWLWGRHVDVKTKARNCYTRPHYEASVEARLRDFDCDWFVFYSYNEPESTMEYCGWFPHSSYFLQARSVGEGDVDFSNQWQASRSCYQMEYKELFNVHLRDSTKEAH